MGGRAAPGDALGLGQAGPIASRIPMPITLFFVMVDAAPHQQVKAAAKAAGVDVASWLRSMMRQIRPSDFPKGWRMRTREPRKPASQRSHDSRQYWKRFMLRLDDHASERFEALATCFDAPHAEVIRQLIVHATLDAFPPSWHVAVHECQEERNG